MTRSESDMSPCTSPCLAGSLTCLSVFAFQSHHTATLGDSQAPFQMPLAVCSDFFGRGYSRCRGRASICRSLPNALRGIRPVCAGALRRR